MSKAKTATVKRMVYENLGITGTNYGDLKTNQRYPSGYIDDAIIGADLTVLKTLMKSKQYHFTKAFYSVAYIPESFAVIDLPSNIELLNVRFYYGTSGAEEQGVEIPWEMFEMFSDPVYSTNNSLFNFTGEGDKKYGGYFSVKDHTLWTIPFDGGKKSITIPPAAAQDMAGYALYVPMDYTLGATDLKSPQSFEEAIAFLASANLLMKRADNPQQSTFYMQQYQAMMGLYMAPSSNQQRTIDQ